MPDIKTDLSYQYSFEMPPDPIPDNMIRKIVKTEVVIIGAGTAGLVCATSAVENGANIVVVSRSKSPVSRGGSNFAFNSRATRELGITLDVNKIYKQQMLNSSFRIDQEKWWMFAHKSGEAMDWLCDKMEAAGYQTVISMNYTDPDGIMTTYPGEHGWKGGSIKNASMGQKLVVNLLADKLKAAGMQIDYKTTAVQLVRENNNTGRATAVIARTPDGTYTKYYGSKAVVLATGDFGADKEMVAKYCPWALPIPGGVYKGDGHKMALWIGAAWQKTVPNAPMINLPPGMGVAPVIGMGHVGLLVNKNGVRYGNEDNLGSTAAIAQIRQPDMKACAIWNVKYAERAAPWPGFTYGAPPRSAAEVVAGWDASVARSKDLSPRIPGIPYVKTIKTDTLEELAQKLDLPLKQFMTTVDRYNSMCRNGVDEDFGKRKSLLIPIDQGPFYGSFFKPWMLIMTGGLRTNTRMQVLDNKEQIIPGLYAVGTISGDLFADYYTFALPGHNLGANCITFGYLAGKTIAGEKN